MKKAVIFDMDGLLVDTEKVNYEIDSALLGRYGKSFSKETYAAAYTGRPLTDNMSRLIRDYCLPLTVPEALDFVIRQDRLYYQTKKAHLKPGAMELLTFLQAQGVRMELATSSQEERVYYILQPLGILNRFRNIVTSAQVKRGKPYPDIFLRAAGLAGAKPQDCLVLEDSEAGIRAANAAGIDAVCIPDLRQPSAQCREMALAVLPDLSAVIGLLTRH